MVKTNFAFLTFVALPLLVNAMEDHQQLSIRTNQLHKQLFQTVAQVNTTEVGFIRYALNETSGTILNFIVLENHRKRGIGSQLFVQALAHMRATGCAKASWTSLPDAAHFYLKRGAREESYLNFSMQLNK